MAETTTSRLQRWIEAMDRPLLGLAILSMCLYLLDLHGLMGSSRAVYLLVNLLIDSIFVVDLLLKLRAQGMTYVRTPWFLIDFLSCLPLLDVLANTIPGVRAARFARGLRILRILRGLRVLRALRTIPAFDEFFDEAPIGESTRKFHRAMNFAMIALTVMVLVTIVAVRRQMTREFLRRIDAGIRAPLTGAHLKALGGSLRRPAHASYVEREVRVDGRMERAYFDLSPVDRQVERDRVLPDPGHALLDDPLHVHPGVSPARRDAATAPRPAEPGPAEAGRGAVPGRSDRL